MITTEYMGICPFCKEKIIGRGDYISHLIRETNKAIEAINEAAKDFLTEGYKIVGIKSPGHKNYHLELKKAQE
nr:MAG TPA: adenylate kinase [Caudoviricetes sp.]